MRIDRFQPPSATPGRPPLSDWPEEDVQTIRELALRTNRGDGLVSLSHAVRRCVHEGKLTPESAEILAREMSSKHYIPKSLRRELEIAPAVVRHHRHPRNAKLAGAYVPGTTRLVADMSRRLYAGERWSGDDGSQNQIVWVPWPWGGTPEADKYGHRTMRGQWLVLHDDATGFILGWVFTLRPRDSYRAQDVLGLVFRVARDVCRPDEAVCEGGSWQSSRALAFYRAAGIMVLDAKGRPHQKLIEGWWNRAWTYLSAHPRGQIGRFRGEYERENDLLVKCRRGTEDARNHFPSLPELLREFEECVAFLNNDRIESPQYGKWIPAERWSDDLTAHPREPLSAELAPFAAPESKIVTIRRGGMVECRTVCPLGISTPYTFADEALMPFEGAKVRVLYDPFEPVVKAAVFLNRDFGRGRSGDLLCMATCLNPPPVPVASEGWEIARDPDAIPAAIAMKKALNDAVRTEYQALGSGGRKIRMTETRGPEGVLRVETGAAAEAAPTRGVPVAARAPSRREATVEDVEKMIADADAAEARLRERGVLNFAGR